MTTSDESRVTLPLVEERLAIDKREVETGRVRIRTHAEDHLARVSEELEREQVVVERVAVNRQIAEPPEIREVNGVLIVPIFEEVLVVEKRLVLKEELHVRRARTRERVEKSATLRRMHADVQRTGRGQSTQPQMARSATTTREDHDMTERSITAFFDSAADAQLARTRLMEAGVTSDSIRILDRSGDGTAAPAGGERRGIWEAIRDFFMPDDDDRMVYEEGLRRGGWLLVARVTDANADRAISVLNECKPIDLDQRATQWQQEGWSGRSRAADTQQEARIPVADERLAVGKREVDRGSVRVRSYVREEPVEEQVRLREEHVEIERRPVNERLSTRSGGTAGEGAWQEREVEMTETGEEPVVSKEAVVKEELVVSKRADERVERVEDTVRHTEVDVEDSRGGKRTPGTGARRPTQRPDQRH
jgi:uncharacterized protein (TIGR02271 family)